MNLYLASAMLVAGPAAADDRGSEPAIEATTGVHAAFEQAEHHRALGNYEDAATLYEAAARAAPKRIEAPEALKEATALRLGLGQLDQAIRNVESFQKAYGATRKADTVELVLVLAATFVEHENFKQARSWLTRAMAQIDGAGKMDDQILAHTWLARSLVRLGDPAGGTREYQRVRDLWRDPGAVMRAVNPKGDDPRRLGKALGALGEALFFFAEQKRAEADAIRMPPFRGRATRDALNRHIQTKVADWVRRKREAIELAEKEYMKILRLEPVPPPQWVIASGARVGQLWDHYVTEFRATPIPDEWKGNGVIPGTQLTFAEVRKSYMRSLEEALEPQRQQAKAAFRTCLDYSVKFQYFDSYARICREWLSERYPEEYPVIREISPPAGKLAFSIPSSPVTPVARGD